MELAEACWHLAKHEKIEKYSKLLLKNNDFSERAKSMLIYAYARNNKLTEARELVKSYSFCHNSMEKLMLKNNLYESDSEKTNFIKRLLWSNFNDMLYSIELMANVNYNGLIIGESNLSYNC